MASRQDSSHLPQSRMRRRRSSLSGTEPRLSLARSVFNRLNFLFKLGVGHDCSSIAHRNLCANQSSLWRKPVCILLLCPQCLGGDFSSLFVLHSNRRPIRLMPARVPGSRDTESLTPDEGGFWNGPPARKFSPKDPTVGVDQSI